MASPLPSLRKWAARAGWIAAFPVPVRVRARLRGTTGRRANHVLLAVKMTWAKRLILATEVLTQLTGARHAIALVLLAVQRSTL